MSQNIGFNPDLAADRPGARTTYNYNLNPDWSGSDSAKSQQPPPYPSSGTSQQPGINNRQAQYQPNVQGNLNKSKLYWLSDFKYDFFCF